MFRDASVLDPAVQNIVQNVIPSVVIQTTLTPPIVIPLNPAAGPLPPNPLLSFLAPTVTLQSDAGPIQIAPYGTGPGLVTDITTWALVAGCVVLAIFGAGMWFGKKSQG